MSSRSNPFEDPCLTTHPESILRISIGADEPKSHYLGPAMLMKYLSDWVGWNPRVYPSPRLDWSDALHVHAHCMRQHYIYIEVNRKNLSRI